MKKTAIKNFAVWARKKLISEITYKAGLIGISEKGISEPLETSTDNIQFFDIGTGKPTEILDQEIKQRDALIKHIKEKESTSDYKTAFQFIVEEVAYTWFNRLIAIRFMEVNDYLPSRTRVLSSETKGKSEPDMVTTPFDTDMEFSSYETDKIMQFKDENKLDKLFRMLFIKQCNKLNEVLPALFEKTADYTELLLTISFTDSDGIVSHLVNDIEEEGFTEAVEIIGWMYQYYNEERKNQVINIYKGNVKKDDIPAATQLFTTDWVVRYMVDNSLGRYWIERNPQSKLQEKLEYFVTPKNGEIHYINEKVTPEEMTFFDPCVGSGHILVYAFDVLMEIYRECGYVDRDAAQSIIENNLFGLDIDDRAYQLAYFAVMMKARSYDRRFLTREIKPNVYPIYDYSDVSISENEDLQYLIDEFKNTKQYGSLINLKKDLDLKKIKEEIEGIRGQLTINTVNISKINNVICIAEILMNKYSVVCTNPPYLNKMNSTLKSYINKHYKKYSSDLFAVFMYKNFEFCKKDGYSSFMTPYVWMSLKKYEELRRFIIEKKSISSLIQMEYSAFEEATVPICTFVLKNSPEQNFGKYVKLSEFRGGMEIQRRKYLEGISNNYCEYVFEFDKNNFLKLSGLPISYWISDQIVKIFYESPMLGDISNPCQGMATTNNDKFLRLWYEVDSSKLGLNCESDDDTHGSFKWFPINKGGKFRKWFGNNSYVVNYQNSGHELCEYIDRTSKVNSTGRIINRHRYFKENGTWSAITSGDLSVRYSPKGYIISNAGMAIYTEHEILVYIIAFLNSKLTTQVLIKTINESLNFNAGDIVRLPLIISDEYKEEIVNLASECIKIAEADWNSYETSWNFKKHPMILECTSLEENYNKFILNVRDCKNQLETYENILNDRFLEIYSLESSILKAFNKDDLTIRKPDLKKDIVSLISYIVGCIFGRYSTDNEGIAFSGGKWNDSLYSSFKPIENNCLIITDEEYVNDDIIVKFEEVLKALLGENNHEENLDFIASILSSKGKTSREILRNYFLKDFIKDHIKTYQKRPIYWLYDSGKQNGFKALIYMHRYTADTTGSVRVDYLHRMQKIYMSEIDRMQDMAQNSTNAREATQAEKRKEKLVKQLKETKEYDEKIAHLALSRIEIDLDDGVKVNYEKVQTSKDGKKLNILKKI